MKKIINGTQVSLDVNFWLDYLYGKALKKITLSNINADLSDINKETAKIIKKYGSLYNSLHPILRNVENDLKYGMLGEAMKETYFINEGALYVKLTSGYIIFKGEHWSLGKCNDGLNLRFKDLTDEPSYFIFYNYLKQQGKNFIPSCFPELYLACDEDENKLLTELDDILTFANVTDGYIPLDYNSIIDVTKKIKYTIIRTATNSKKAVLEIDASSGSAKKANSSSASISIYKQAAVEINRNSKLYGTETKLSDTSIFDDLTKKLQAKPSAKIRGIIINDVLYYELDSDIYRCEKDKSVKVIQNGTLYGCLDGNLLVAHAKQREERVYQHTIYLLKNNMIDPVKYYFDVKGETNA